MFIMLEAGMVARDGMEVLLVLEATAQGTLEMIIQEMVGTQGFKPTPRLMATLGLLF